MNLSVFCGVSVDGFLARPDHALDFLQTGEKTFEVVLTFGKCF